MWRLGTWECERVLTGHNGGVVGVCVANGNLVSASNDSFIKVWNSAGVQRPFTASKSGEEAVSGERRRPISALYATNNRPLSETLPRC